MGWLSYRKIFVLFLTFAGLFFAPFPIDAAPYYSDGYLWLEDIYGTMATDWVQRENSRTLATLEADPMYPVFFREIEGVLLASDRVPFSEFSRGYFWNFWQDAAHPKGVLRRTSLADYRTSDPKWEILLDLDQLASVEKVDWIYKGRTRLSKNSSRWLLQLSRGGKDAVELREYDFETKRFISDGFNLPEAKTAVSAIDDNSIFIATDFGPGSMTDSGYARIIKLWRRGQPLADAETVFQGEVADVSVSSIVVKEGERQHKIFKRAVDFFRSEFFLYEAQTLRKLPISLNSRLLSIEGGFVYILSKETTDVGGRELPTNSVIRFPLAATTLENAEVIFTANARQSIDDAGVRGGRVIINVLDNIKSKVFELHRSEAGNWESTTLPFPTTGILGLSLSDPDDPSDITTLTYTDHLTPQSQYLVHDSDGSYRLELLKQAPARFESSDLEVVQNFVASKDGTSIPYFVLKRKNLVLDGSHPTILYGYGGFEISLKPAYSGVIGKAWLERGGVYVIANIRGGGEFGPAWHQAALRENRQRAFDDFASVAEDVIRRGITSPKHLGIKGGSNGGLLVGTTMVQRPELFNAALVQVPLLDMLRFSKLLAGASWMAEYGDPDNTEDCANLLSYSPYHNVEASRKYPNPMFTTSTRDDRVHPGHARKMAARMKELGHDVTYFENVTGGHTGTTTPREQARVQALEHTYLWRRLR